MTSWIFKENSVLAKMEEVSHFWAQNQHFRTFSKSIHWIFVKLYLMTGIKKLFKVTVLILVENPSYARNGLNRTFLGPKLIFLEFSLKLFIRLNYSLYFFEVVHDQRH